MIAGIYKFLDFFYPIVSRIFDKKTYYYAVVGVSNLLLSWVLFFLCYQFLFDKQFFTVSLNSALSFTFSPYTLSALVCTAFSFVYGFTLLKFIVFTESDLKGRIQLVRYAMTAGISAISSWLLLKFFIEWLHIFPSIANVIASCIVVILSYVLQRKFTFKN
jgi:putative flippase GtrA